MERGKGGEGCRANSVSDATRAAVGKRAQRQQVHHPLCQQPRQMMPADGGRSDSAIPGAGGKPESRSAAGDRKATSSRETRYWQRRGGSACSGRGGLTERRRKGRNRLHRWNWLAIGGEQSDPTALLLRRELIKVFPDPDRTFMPAINSVNAIGAASVASIPPTANASARSHVNLSQEGCHEREGRGGQGKR